jgi:signal transduction histidine kinase
MGSLPRVVAALTLAGAPHGSTLVMACLWSIVQISLLALLVVGHTREWRQPRLQTAVATDLGRRAELAEAAVRREQERLHELRATVSGIGMTHRLLHERTADLPPPTRTRLEGLYESELSRLARLVDEGQSETDAVETLDVSSLIAPLVESLRLRGVPVTCRGSAVAAGRPDEVVEIVHNLLENAARHAGGAEISVAVSAEADQVRVAVSDSGPGIPERLRPRLFERGARREGSPGHGLGLHIARRLAREMGGDLRLEPRGSGGATFTLMLPASLDGAACLATAD